MKKWCIRFEGSEAKANDLLDKTMDAKLPATYLYRVTRKTAKNPSGETLYGAAMVKTRPKKTKR